MAGTPRRAALAGLAALVLALAFATSASAATFNVDSTDDTSDVAPGDGACQDDDGNCTLRAAIDEANALDGDDTVNLPDGLYSFDSWAPALTIAAATKVTIVGESARFTEIDADGSDRVFDIGVAGSLVASDVTIRGGRAGCIDCGQVGGGVRVAAFGSLELTDSVVTRNIAAAGGGIAIRPDARVKLTRVTLDHNLAVGFVEGPTGEGGAIYNDDGALEVIDSSLYANSANSNGGAIQNWFSPSDGPDSLSDEARGYEIVGSTVYDNIAGSSDGGAIATYPSCECNDENIGQFDFSGLEQSIVNSTISGNTAAQRGGAIYHVPGVLAIESSTIYDADALNGSGLIFTARGDWVTARNSILALGSSAGEADNCNTEIESLGYNLSSGSSCGLDEPTDQQDVDPELDYLDYNGGETLTHALLDGSPAIDAGLNDAGPELDQRGGDRPPADGSAGAVRDIGAYEANSLGDLSIDVKAAAPDPATVGQPLTYTIVVRNDGPDAINGVRLTDVLPPNTELVSAGDCTAGLSCDLETVDPGEVVTVTIVVRPTAAGGLTNTATVGAAGMTDLDSENDSATVTTRVDPAPAPPPAPQPPEQQQQQQTQQTQTETQQTQTQTQQTQPQQQEPRDDSVKVVLTAPRSASISDLLDGIVVEAQCEGERCMRRFRVHGLVRSGFNLTVARASLADTANRTKVRLLPCKTSSGRRSSRCLSNLRSAVRRAGTFRAKVVVSVVDAAGNKGYAKAFIRIVP